MGLATNVLLYGIKLFLSKPAAKSKSFEIKVGVQVPLWLVADESTGADLISIAAGVGIVGGGVPLVALVVWHNGANGSKLWIGVLGVIVVVAPVSVVPVGSVVVIFSVAHDRGDELSAVGDDLGDDGPPHKMELPVSPGNGLVGEEVDALAATTASGLSSSRLVHRLVESVGKLA